MAGLEGRHVTVAGLESPRGALSTRVTVAEPGKSLACLSARVGARTWPLCPGCTGVCGRFAWSRTRHRVGRGRIIIVPELPEVQSLAADLQERAVGRVVERADIAEFSVLKTYDPPLSALSGATITGTARYGKFLDLLADPPASSAGSANCISSRTWPRPAGCAGATSCGDTPPKPGKGPLAFRLKFTDGAGFDLTEAGTRKRLAVYLVTDPLAVPGIASLGPDPLAPDFTVEVLAGLLKERRTQIKGVLRDQKIIAGIGNAYSDEVLHAAKMSPFKLASSLTDDDIADLHNVIITTLRTAIERSAGLAASELKAEKKAGLAVHGRAGQNCPVCGDVVREVSFADSALQYCATCQTGGKPLADRRLSRLLK